MKCDTELVSFIKKTFDSDEDISEVMEKSSLPFFLLSSMKGTDKVITSNRLYEKLVCLELNKITSEFSRKNIKYIYFKGVALAKQLYKESYMRRVGDVDIYVFDDDFECALNLLLDSGYGYISEDTVYNQHHIVLIKSIFVVELHRNILSPRLQINTVFLESHISSVFIEKNDIYTFDKTATLLHMIYHLYMDVFLITGNLYFLYGHKQVSVEQRFLYRAYEIARFTELYYDDIDWNDVVCDINGQNLQIIFKYMCLNVVRIFPDIFPDIFYRGIVDKQYMTSDNYQIYEHIMGDKRKIDEILSEYVDKCWGNLNRGCSINYPMKREVTLTRLCAAELPMNIGCVSSIRFYQGNLVFSFRVPDDDIVFSDDLSFEPLTSDGIHFLVCQTEPYQYRSFFAFPKKHDDGVSVVFYDVLLKKVISDGSVSAKIMVFDGYYDMEVIISNSFFKNNLLPPFFYFGTVISDCDVNGVRKRDMISSPIKEEWYNPIYFLKIGIQI